MIAALLLAACFLGTGEVDAQRYVVSEGCWAWDTLEVDNWYWSQYTASGRACSDGAIQWFANADGECWHLMSECGENWLDDPMVAEVGSPEQEFCTSTEVREAPHCRE